MNQSGRRRSQIKKQRTTLTLPSDSLAKAKRIARARGVNLGAVVSEALSEGLRLHAATERPEQVPAAYLVRYRFRIRSVSLRHQRRELVGAY
jgi:post-segregation antitoxin (ccd killing protein)